MHYVYCEYIAFGQIFVYTNILKIMILFFVGFTNLKLCKVLWFKQNYNVNVTAL